MSPGPTLLSVPYDDDEPVFKRSRFGPNRYVFNPRNPIGRVLIVVTLVVVGVVMLMMAGHVGPFR